MGIQELDKELHKHDADLREPHEKSAFNPENVPEGAEIRLSGTSEWRGARERFFTKNAKAVRWGAIAVGGIAFVSLLVGTFVRIQQSLFSEDRVTVTVSGPENVNSSTLTTFVISFSNGNRSRLSGAELVVSYPPSFRPEGNDNTFRSDGTSNIVTIGDIPAFETKSLEFSGKFYGSKNSPAFLSAELRYRPANLESRFSAIGRKSLNLRSASLAIELEVPLTVSPEGEVNYLADYENTSDTPLSTIRLKATYPPGFSFTESEPAPSEGETIWYLGSINAGEKGRVRITGRLSGVPNETKTLRVEMGTFQGDNTFFALSDVERTTRVVAPPFEIRQTLNGGSPATVNPGEILRYAVSYRNDSNIRLREAILAVKVEGDALDFANLRSEGGAFDDRRNIITWKASDVPALANLAPNASGTVKFTVPVRDDFVPESTLSKNFRIKTIATIESPDIPNPAGANKIISTNTKEAKVNSRIRLETLGFYQDNAISNTGPIPPTVGEETTYTLRWRLSNTTNDVTAAEVSADLPTGVRWTGVIFPQSESVSYNERTNKIVWNVGSLGVGVGILSPKKEVAFQVSLRPAVNQINTEALLLGASTAKATDVFTDETLRAETNEKTTNLREDTSLPSNGYKVKGSEN